MEVFAEGPLGEEGLWGSRHPGERELERFMRGAVSRREARSVVRHMLTGCPRCSDFTRPFWRLAEEGLAVTDAEAFARIQLQEIERELQRIRYRMLGVQATLPPAPVDLARQLEEETLSGTTLLHAVIRCVLQDSIEPAIHDLRELSALSEQA